MWSLFEKGSAVHVGMTARECLDTCEQEGENHDLYSEVVHLPEEYDLVIMKHGGNEYEHYGDLYAAADKVRGACYAGLAGSV